MQYNIISQCCHWPQWPAYIRSTILGYCSDPHENFTCGQLQYWLSEYIPLLQTSDIQLPITLQIDLTVRMEH